MAYIGSKESHNLSSEGDYKLRRDYRSSCDLFPNLINILLIISDITPKHIKG